MEIERTRIHLLSDVVAAVAALIGSLIYHDGNDGENIA